MELYLLSKLQLNRLIFVDVLCINIRHLAYQSSTLCKSLRVVHLHLLTVINSVTSINYKVKCGAVNHISSHYINFMDR